MSELRTFAGIPLPDAARSALVPTLEGLRDAWPEARWVDPANLHLTLKFCGPVDADLVPQLVAKLGARCAAARPIDLEIAGLGAFPSARDARTVWAGIAVGGAELAKLARKLDAAAGRLGVERERRPYRAHLTLGRLRRATRLALERLEAPKGIAFRATDVVFFESRLSPRGAQYVPLACLPLGAQDADGIDFAPEP